MSGLTFLFWFGLACVVVGATIGFLFGGIMGATKRADDEQRNWGLRKGGVNFPVDYDLERPGPPAFQPVVIREGSVKKNLNDPPTTPRPAAPRSQMAPSEYTPPVAPLSDDEYRQKLVARGVLLDDVATASGADLDRCGNLIGVYRTSMRDPTRYWTEHFASTRKKRGEAT